MSTIKTKHAVAGIVLGVLSGFTMAVVMAELTLMVVMSAAPVLLLPTLAISFLAVWAGLPSGIVSTVSILTMSFALGGGTLALVIFEMCVIPAWCVVALIARRSKYYDGVKQSVAMQCGALFVLIAGAWLTIGGDLVEYAMSAIKSSVVAYPNDYSSVFLAYMGEVTRVFLSLMGQMGLFGGQTGLDFTKALTPAEQTALVNAVFAANTTQLKQTLASILLSVGVTTGAASYALCAYITSRRGDDPIIDYAHPKDWRLAPSLIIGPAACAIICYIAYALGMGGADSAYIAFYSLCVILFMVQGIGAVDRRFRQSGATAALRVFAIVILVITGLRELLALIGVASALFGSKGLVSAAIKKYKDKGDGRQ